MLAEAAEGRRSSAAQAYVPTQVHVAAPPTPTEQSTAIGVRQPVTPASGGRKWPRVVAVALAAALVGGGGVFAANHYLNDRTSSDSNSGKDGAPSTSAGSGNGKHKSGSIPDDWVRVDDVEGYSLMLPKDWKRQADGTQVDYTPDRGAHFVRIAVDKSPDWPDSYHHQLDLERQVTKPPGLPDYQQVNLQPNTYRDRSGSLWEFTWTAGNKDTTSGPRHAIEQTYVENDGTEYAIYLSVPEADWDEGRQQFDAILRGWEP
jgi:hypothetical protein